ncbi:hypothetical protein [Leucobacter sp. GX24907]
MCERHAQATPTNEESAPRQNPKRHRTGGYLDRSWSSDAYPANIRSAELFVRLVAGTQQNFADGRESGSIQPAFDPEVTALLVTVFGLAQFLVRDRLAGVLGADPFSVEGAARLTLPTLEIFTNGIYADTGLLDAARIALAQQGEAVTNDGRDES